MYRKRRERTIIRVVTAMKDAFIRDKRDHIWVTTLGSRKRYGTQAVRCAMYVHYRVRSWEDASAKGDSQTA